MDRTVNEPRPDAPAQADGIHASDDERVVAFPSLHTLDASSDQRSEHVSDAEIAQLVSVALEDALVALGQRNPETWLRLRACEARAGIREMLSALPRAKARETGALDQYRKAMVFQNLALDLSLKLVDSIRRYARVYEREIPAALA